MKQIEPSNNKEKWPRWSAPTIECRKRDLVVRIASWLDDKDEPAYDVEVYIGGVYDWNESKAFTLHEHKHAAVAREKAVKFAQAQIAKLL